MTVDSRSLDCISCSFHFRCSLSDVRHHSFDFPFSIRKFTDYETTCINIKFINFIGINNSLSHKTNHNN